MQIFISKKNSIKLKLIDFLRSRGCLGSNLTNPSGRSLTDWRRERIPAPQDSERCVEVPWAASAISRTSGLWLDIGYAHAERRFWDAIQGNKVWIRCGYGYDVSPSKGTDPLDVHILGNLIDDDLSALPDFDLVTCISTLEHIGCDNRIYHEKVTRQDRPLEIQQKCLTKLLFKLKSGGRLFLSLPFGKSQDHGWFIQYDQGTVRSLVQAASQAKSSLVEEMYYKVDSEGWKKVPISELSNTPYQPEQKRASGVVLLEFEKQK